MTKKDYIKIADVLGNKLKQVSSWNNIEARSLSIAYIEDFMSMLNNDNPRFDKNKFIEYINKKYQVELLRS